MRVVEEEVMEEMVKTDFLVNAENRELQANQVRMGIEDHQV